ncbi:hypothetical protein [Dactylosporangium sp. NPDC048998]|uniref:hypothetical protein n=1 Tax=Dactylosporangium sp. NPDC048998 TaxID=3363976 RepID=UPI00371D1E09
MRDRTLGRWIVRLAVTIGAGTVALGLSGAAAHANVVSQSRFVAVPISLGVTKAPSITPVTERVFVKEDYGWE